MHVRPFLFKLARALGLAAFGYVGVRVLAALGVPFDRWAIQIANFLIGVQVRISPELILTLAAVLFSAALITVELWLEPIGRLLRRLRPPVPYLNDQDTELTHAVLMMTLRSQWGRWFARREKMATGEDIDQKYHMQFASTLVVEAAMNGRLEIRGRYPGGIAYEAIPREMWRLIALQVVPDDSTIHKLKVITRHNVPPERVKRALEYDSLIVNSAQFQAIWPT